MSRTELRKIKPKSTGFVVFQACCALVVVLIGLNGIASSLHYVFGEDVDLGYFMLFLGMVLVAFGCWALVRHGNKLTGIGQFNRDIEIANTILLIDAACSNNQLMELPVGIFWKAMYKPAITKDMCGNDIDGCTPEMIRRQADIFRQTLIKVEQWQNKSLSEFSQCAQ